MTIDGVNISDTFGLNANNLPTLKQPISIDAIQSVQVNLSNYDVHPEGLHRRQHQRHHQERHQRVQRQHLLRLA